MSIGMKAYARELAERLPRVAPDMEFAIFREGPNFGVEEQIRLPAAIRGARVDLTHFLSLYTPAFAPRPYAVTIHDLIHLRFPQYFKSKVRPYYQTVVRLVCARATRVITDDERTVSDLQRFLGVDAEKVRVIPLGVDEVFLKTTAPYRAERPYFIYAGNHREHKDLQTLFKAWEALPGDLAIDLYVTGPDDFGANRPHRMAGTFVVLGEVPPESLAAYYAGAVALVHPALCEGFGLPMVEAMGSGTAVIACDDAIPGELRDAALTFRARDAAEARACMLQILQNEGLRLRLVNEARARAATLTWDRCAQATAAVYREIVEVR